MKEGRGDDRDGGWGSTESHSEKKGWAKQDGRASYFVLWEKNSCKNIIGRKINRLEPEGVNSSQPVILIVMEKDRGQSLQLAVRGCPIGWISLLRGIAFNLYSRRGRNHRRVGERSYKEHSWN